ncbi:DUF6083 domain-containing protein [Streptomyces sp. NBS 14/10]|uniref:DUF6083 domain-containing protein n=1 Tax=Streptomyces sp. NBS 14/10 TaxID=1945643 RepID=UPI000B9CD15D|nr:DUF6083 domain-containing protein [Streptomyces sp. NBS 14/10]KAK1184398.1 DUF6083 domain-containing protein [Streptomyces sp. NBS 14/10]
MHATTSASDRAWDGSYKHRHPPRFLRVAPDSPTRLLRTAQQGQCSSCGNHIEWYNRTTGHNPIPLHPHELPAAAVPASQRWHIDSGIAHPSGDGSPWCRVRHRALCPATPAEAHSSTMDALRRHLALTSRRLQDTGHFTPPPPPHPDPPTPDTAPQTRPVVQFLCLRYLAPGPLEHIPCVAQTRARRRCPHPVLDPDALPGTWILTPLHPAHDPGQLPLTELWLALYDLNHLPYSEQLRWRAQRCTAHATAPEAADIARTAWEPLNPRTHHQHIQHHLPDTAPPSGPRGRR